MDESQLSDNDCPGVGCVVKPGRKRHERQVRWSFGRGLGEYEEEKSVLILWEEEDEDEEEEKSMLILWEEEDEDEEEEKSMLILWEEEDED